VVFGNSTISLHILRGVLAAAAIYGSLATPYYLAFDYSAPSSCLSNEGLTDVLDHGSHGNDCKGRSCINAKSANSLLDGFCFRNHVLCQIRHWRIPENHAAIGV
jgi:hypothetical protein